MNHHFRFSSVVVSLMTMFVHLQANASEVFQNTVNVDFVKSIACHPVGLPLSYPIIQLSEHPVPLQVSFDDLESDLKNYTYKIEHCDKDWRSSGLNEMEFVDGYFELDVEEFSFSALTFQDYVHYSFTIPNEDMKITLSGNYILKVFAEGDYETPAFTQRFVVVEPNINLNVNVGSPSNPKYYPEYQQLDITADLRKMNTIASTGELTIGVCQGGNLSDIKMFDQPRIIRDQVYYFDGTSAVHFRGLKEFRHFDLRSIRFPGDQVGELERTGTGYRALIGTQESRLYQSYLYHVDANGKFVLDNHEESSPTTESEYLEVRLSLQHQRIEQPLYVWGSLTDWQTDSTSQMKYDDESGIYYLDVLLKQGYYNYLFVAGNPSTYEDFDWMEGSSYQTENEYQVFAYFRHPSKAYDQLIGYKLINSIKDEKRRD